jgi:hypothetical protein
MSRKAQLVARLDREKYRQVSFAIDLKGGPVKIDAERSNDGKRVRSTRDGAERGSSCVGKPPGARGGGMASEEMRKEYDFSKGVRDKFYRPSLKLSLPVYLDQQAMAFVQRIARKKKTDISTVVNKLILTDKHLVEVME